MSIGLSAEYVKPAGFVGTARKASDIKGYMIHMAEGNNVAAYLSRNPARGVSVNYTVEADGTVRRMVPELRVAGSLDPAALRTDTGPYYGRSHLDYVLGSAGARNPNVFCIAVEVAGTAAKGPNAKQVAALVRLFNDCRTRYPWIKPLGHRDQQDVKPCPGGTPAMRLAFASMGGHGKDYVKPKPVPKPPPPPPVIEDCAQALAAEKAKVADLQDQVDALQAAIASAIGTLDAAPGGPT